MFMRPDESCAKLNSKIKGTTAVNIQEFKQSCKRPNHPGLPFLSSDISHLRRSLLQVFDFVYVVDTVFHYQEENGMTVKIADGEKIRIF